MLGFYENFPNKPHILKKYAVSVSTKNLQQKLIKVINKINNAKFTFEEVSYPSVPDSTIILEIGIADSKNFNFVDEEETKNFLRIIKKNHLGIIDLFCAIRYYRNVGKKKAYLKFDYYMIRTIFYKNYLEMQAFHERGPRHISPKDVTALLVNNINKISFRKILKPIEKG